MSHELDLPRSCTCGTMLTETPEVVDGEVCVVCDWCGEVWDPLYVVPDVSAGGGEDNQ